MNVSLAVHHHEFRPGFATDRTTQNLTIHAYGVLDVSVVGALICTSIKMQG